MTYTVSENDIQLYSWSRSINTKEAIDLELAVSHAWYFLTYGMSK